MNCLRKLELIDLISFKMLTRSCHICWTQSPVGVVLDASHHDVNMTFSFRGTGTLSIAILIVGKRFQQPTTAVMEPKAFAGDLSICNVHLSTLHSTLQFVLDVKLFTIFGRKQQLLMKSDTLGGIRVENYAAFFIKMCPPDVQVLFQRCNTLCNENCAHITNRSCNCSSFLY